MKETKIADIVQMHHDQRHSGEAVSLMASTRSRNKEDREIRMKWQAKMDEKTARRLLKEARDAARYWEHAYGVALSRIGQTTDPVEEHRQIDRTLRLARRWRADYEMGLTLYSLG